MLQHSNHANLNCVTIWKVIMFAQRKVFYRNADSLNKILTYRDVPFDNPIYKMLE
jgi:hypothetical protein